jgi:hypothetical protein
MMEGLPVIGLGLLVVLVIILSMFVSIELILKFDQVLSDWTRRVRTPRKAPQPEPSPAPDRNPDDVIAAIGLALHRHLSEAAATGSQVTSAASGAASSFGSASWASSGRAEIMSSRREMTSRYRRRGEERTR